MNACFASESDAGRKEPLDGICPFAVEPDREEVPYIGAWYPYASMLSSTGMSHAEWTGPSLSAAAGVLRSLSLSCRHGFPRGGCDGPSEGGNISVDHHANQLLERNVRLPTE